ncbi:unnamed protein product [Adineta ricciae]|uniref:Uncharacterized protein n=1 Tax=Adineta ricciae TaxID=249248 RepID=A0A815B4G3_ADIRI|nr:unnamed protein product [Adineta ricciae]
MSSSREIIKENHNHNIDDNTDSIKDEQVRRDIRVLSARLTDLKERFMNIVQKINEDAVGYVDQISDEALKDQMMKRLSIRKIMVWCIEKNSNEASNTDDDSEEDQTNKSPMRIRMSQLMIESIIDRQARHNGYLQHLPQYPKIMQYLVSNKPSRTKISLRHIDPFIKEHVDENPNEKIYEKISKEIQVIRRKYLKNRK